MRVLLVDDDNALRKALIRLLTSCYKCEAVGFESARDALDAIRQEPEKFDAVISDVDMPIMGGPDFFESLRDLAPKLAEHFVFYTGMNGRSPFFDRVKALNQRVIEKDGPSSLKLVYEALTNMLVAV